MKLSDFDFKLPEELIAQSPLENRDQSRLMIVDKTNGVLTHTKFFNIINYLNKGDILVRNITKVIPARLFGVKKETNATVEVLLLRNTSNNNWECLVGNARVVKLGSEIYFSDSLKAKCVEVKDEGIRILEMIFNGVFLEIIDKLGETPLPPYIKTRLDDKTRYQTIYAKAPGSAAAPTAGFHFTENLFKIIENKGIKVVDITLHVGLGTFRPIKVDDVESHKMHAEYYQVDKMAAKVLEEARQAKQRIIAIGTTSARTLETVINKHGAFVESSGFTDIYIYPGYKFNAIKGLITNFHLPKSSLILMVSAFASKTIILNAYEEAIKEKYRFFSFGDAMFIK